MESKVDACKAIKLALRSSPVNVKLIQPQLTGRPQASIVTSEGTAAGSQPVVSTAATGLGSSTGVLGRSLLSFMALW